MDTNSTLFPFLFLIAISPLCMYLGRKLRDRQAQHSLRKPTLTAEQREFLHSDDLPRLRTWTDEEREILYKMADETDPNNRNP